MTLYSDTYYPPVDVSGSRQAAAIFAEMDVPMSKNLDVNISDREDRYSDFGETNNGKISAALPAIARPDLQGSASTGFRAPSLVDLYLPDQFGAAAGSTMPGPPCASGQYTTVFSYTNCHSQGLQLAGGNTKLQPETSENFDLGVVIEPIANLGITLDYYKILIKNSIQALQDDTIYENPDCIHRRLCAEFIRNTDARASSQHTMPAVHGTDLWIHHPQEAEHRWYQDLGSRPERAVSAAHTHRSASMRISKGPRSRNIRFQEYTGGPQLNLVGWFNRRQ